MQRFYFHLHNDVEAADPQGTEHPDLNAARQHALREIRFTAGETLKETGRINLKHRIDIEDEHGDVLATVTFGDALRIEC